MSYLCHIVNNFIFYHRTNEFMGLNSSNNSKIIVIGNK